MTGRRTNLDWFEKQEKDLVVHRFARCCFVKHSKGLNDYSLHLLINPETEANIEFVDGDILAAESVSAQLTDL